MEMQSVTRVMLYTNITFTFDINLALFDLCRKRKEVLVK